MNQQLIAAKATARIIKRKFDARVVFVLDNSTREISDQRQAYVLATDDEMRDQFPGCDDFIVARI